jgi:hypothetical protein
MTQTEKVAEQIKVMQAYLNGKQIEAKSYYSVLDWEVVMCPTWNWYAQDYRVKPEKPLYRPWNLGEIPVGCTICFKQNPSSKVLISANTGGRVWCCGKANSAEGVLRNYTMPDGSPCGIPT